MKYVPGESEKSNRSRRVAGAFVPPPMPVIPPSPAADSRPVDPTPAVVAPADNPPPRISKITRIAVLLAVAIIGLINMPGTRWVGDPTAWREETRSLLHRHTLAIDPSIPATFNSENEPGQYFVQNIRNGQWYSKYGIVNGLMSFPPMLIQRLAFGDMAAPLSQPNLLIFNLWNILLSVALAGVLLSLASLYTSRASTIVLFIGVTFYCTYLSIYLRAQTSEIYQTLFYCAAFLFLIKFLRSLDQSSSRFDLRSLLLMWLFIAVMALTRVLYILLIPLCGLWMVIAAYQLPPAQRIMALRKLWMPVFLPPAAILGLCGLVNFIKFGSPFLSGYHQWKPELHLPTGAMRDGLYGLLLDPRFSVFLYFPPLVFALLWTWRFARRYPLEAAAALGGLVTFILALSKIPTWRGEWTYGPRYILFALPVASLPFLSLLDGLIAKAKRQRFLTAAIAAPIAAVLLYSGYLQCRVNQVDFFAFYYIRPPDYDEVISSFFDGQPVGMTIDEIQRNRDHLELMPWFTELQKFRSPANIEAYRTMVLQVLDRRNFFWVTETEKSTAGAKP